MGSNMFGSRTNASVNSSSAHPPPPPGLTPGHTHFFFKNGQIPPGWGQISCLNAPGWRQRKRANALPPGSSPSNTSTVFFINQWINRSTFQYFNAIVLKTSRTTVRSLRKQPSFFAPSRVAIHRRKFHTDDENLSRIWSWALIGSTCNYA